MCLISIILQMENLVLSPISTDTLIERIAKRTAELLTNNTPQTPQPEKESTLLTTKEFSEYSGLSLSHIYKLTHGRRIPFFRPMGKTIYFKKTDVDNFLLQNRQSTKSEIENEANAYLLNKKK